MMMAWIKTFLKNSKLPHFVMGSAILWVLPASFNPLSSILAPLIPSVLAPALLIPCITAGISILTYSIIPEKFKKISKLLRLLAFLSLGPLCTFGVCAHKAYKIHSEGSFRARAIVLSLIALYIVAAFLNPVPMPPLISHLFLGTFFTGLFYLGCFILIAANTIHYKDKPRSPSYILGCLFNLTQTETVKKTNPETKKNQGIEQLLRSLIPNALQDFSDTLVNAILGIYRATKTLSEVLLGSSLVQSLEQMTSHPKSKALAPSPMPPSKRADNQTKSISANPLSSRRP